MMQGDSYGLEIEIRDSENQVVTDASVSDVEIAIGTIKKTYKSGKVLFSNGKWIIPLKQEETFRFPKTGVKAQVRVVWANGNVEGCSLGRISVFESISKEVL